MSFGHERLDVYRAAIAYVGWAYRFCEGLKGHRNAKEQLLRASQAIPLNIAEGNGKATDGDRTSRSPEDRPWNAARFGMLWKSVVPCPPRRTPEPKRCSTNSPEAAG